MFPADERLNSSLVARAFDKHVHIDITRVVEWLERRDCNRHG